MKSKYLLVFGIYFACACILVQYVSAQLDSANPYCFRFTWLGPDYTNDSTLTNTTCSQRLEDSRAVDVPCSQPFVITYDGTPPDIDFLWENHASQVVCRRALDRVCAKFTYSFNNVVQNATYMCTRAYSVGEGPVTSGCFQQTVDGVQVEVCFCQSVAGYRPCNGATSFKLSVTLLTALISLKYVFKLF